MSLLKTPQDRLSLMCVDIREILTENEVLKAEVERLKEYERRYLSLLDECNRHNTHMMSQLLDLTLSQCVADRGKPDLPTCQTR